MDTIAKRVRRTTGISGAGARKRESNKIKRQMRNAARRVSAGGQGG